jgi:hypothetical protein
VSNFTREDHLRNAQTADLRGHAVSSDVTFEAIIPAEPVGLLAIIDRDGDIWQRRTNSQWECTRAKIQGLGAFPFGSSHNTKWRNLVVTFGPLVALRWEEATELAPAENTTHPKGPS